MKFYLRDRNPAITEAWTDFFKDVPDFEISTGNIFEGPKADAIVSPANSFGFMDGGIDAVYSWKFGFGLEERLRTLLATDYDGELPVGMAVIVPTNYPDYPFLVSAPTMRVPTCVKGTANAYLAFRATLQAVKKHNKLADEYDKTMETFNDSRRATAINSILCPGLGTAVGQMSPWCCARQMYEAYKSIWLEQPIKPKDCGDIYYQHEELIGWDKYAKKCCKTVEGEKTCHDE